MPRQQNIGKITTYRQIKLLTLMVVTFTMAACGFTPLYQQQDNGQNALLATFDRIEIAPIPNRIGQILRNDLLDHLTPRGENGDSKYRLIVNLNEQRQGFGFRDDNSVTRENLRLEASFQLIDLDSKQPVYEGNASSNMTYDLVSSDFANLSAYQDALIRTAEQISNTIVTRLGFYFKNKQD